MILNNMIFFETPKWHFSFDNDWGSFGDSPTFNPVWIDANRVIRITDTRQLPIRDIRRTHIVVKEAKEPPVIYDIT